MPTPAIFLDRDGTLIVERNYLSDPGQVEILPTVAESLVRLADAGYLLVIITNQSGIGRGYFTTERLEEIHQRMLYLLGVSGVLINAIYICPHAPSQDCQCRKPLPQMIYQAAEDLMIDLDRSWVIGDKPADIGLSSTVGGGAILVRTGYGEQMKNDPLIQSLRPFIADNLAQAVDEILSKSSAISAHECE